MEGLKLPAWIEVRAGTETMQVVALAPANYQRLQSAETTSALFAWLFFGTIAAIILLGIAIGKDADQDQRS